MKKIISYLILVFFFLNSTLTTFADDEDISDIPVNLEQTYFVVTAYYSPLPNQQHYLKWNYEDEIILNWEWIKWASWKKVYPWMLAWPKNYSFWTKIYLEWVWVWSIDDRWWAIVQAWVRGYEYDRIDMWMWYWEEWLKRALAWWKRVVPGYVINDNSTQTSIDLAKFPSPDIAVAWLTAKAKTVYSNDVFNSNQTPESSSENILKLQKAMFELWLLKSDKITWKYDDLKEALISYQLDKWIITSKTSDDAWYFGPKTRKKMWDEYESLWEQRKIETQLANIRTQAENTIWLVMKKVWTPKLWDNSKNTKYLQQLLIALKVSPNLKASWSFWDKTEIALKRYQLSRKIISDFDEDGAWIYWPKTQEQLKNDLINIYEKQLLKKSWLIAYKK